MQQMLMLRFALLSICCLPAQDIKGTLVLKSGESIEGTISQLQLTGGNKGWVYIETGDRLSLQ